MHIRFKLYHYFIWYTCCEYDVPDMLVWQGWSEFFGRQVGRRDKLSAKLLLITTLFGNKLNVMLSNPASVHLLKRFLFFRPLLQNMVIRKQYRWTTGDCNGI